MSSITYPLRFKKPIMELAELRAREEHTDKTTAIRQLLYTGAEEYGIGLYKMAEFLWARLQNCLTKMFTK